MGEKAVFRQNFGKSFSNHFSAAWVLRMETSLHRQLKQHYAASESDTEVVVGSYRIDAIREDELVEIQCASLAAIRAKASSLLPQHRLRIVKPVILRTRIRRMARVGGRVTSCRLSPRRGSILDIFDDLIYFTRVFPHRNLVIEVPMVHVCETRLPAKKRRRGRRADYQVHDVELESIGECYEFRDSLDLLSVVPWPVQADRVSTEDLAKAIDRPRWYAQKTAYVLRHIGAIEPNGRSRTGIHYRPARAA